MKNLARIKFPQVSGLERGHPDGPAVASIGIVATSKFPVCGQVRSCQTHETRLPSKPDAPARGIRIGPTKAANSRLPRHDHPLGKREPRVGVGDQATGVGAGPVAEEERVDVGGVELFVAS
jgi:hypothetical protein